MKSIFRNKLIFTKRKKGAYLPAILLLSVLFIAYAVAIVSFSMFNLKTAILHNKKITSMSLAEAGINYYMWHLGHNNNDFCDGNVCQESETQGPFLHNYYDQSGVPLGTYELTITPPEPGQTKTVIKSTGKVKGTSPKRTIIATVEMPAYTKHAIVANNYYVYTEDWERIEGNVHVNNSGIYNRGHIKGNSSTNLAEDADFEIFGFGRFSPTMIDTPDTEGTFEGEKNFNAEQISFPLIQTNILENREKTMSGEIGHYYPDPSGYRGYHIVFKGDSYSLYKVRRANDGLSIEQESKINDYAIPNDGVIFCETEVWVEGTVDNNRVTLIASDRNASTSSRKRIIINDSLLYSARDGNSKIGLIATGDISTLRFPIHPTMEIDAAMISLHGIIWYPTSWYKTRVDGKLTVWGSAYHNGGLSWSWSYDIDTPWQGGFRQVAILFDPHNAYSPPPYFPNSGKFEITSWREE